MPELTSTIPVLLIWAIVGYLLGSIPSGVVVAKAMGLGNLREIGSGNIGATNVLRTGSKPAAALTLLFDAGKGALAVLLARAVSGEDAAQVAALLAFLGHCFPVWLGFRGGKGVATYFGIMLALVPIAGLIACGIWLATAAISRYSSLAALFVAGWTPVVMAFTTDGKAFILAAILGLLIYARHLGNIKRIKAGTEHKIGQSKS
ncbi:acyl-phosphate glycerol-3-phosphate acyltransferase [Cognatiyoonia koreensis]|uniref:Glycerol-3-phosphate acyltransferase n=1 Tax=Cognatiyoonia koreensis TaxID=364200 RepID=A0A1I0RE31_9RHOB|nr:glycerol-3-phosphate 1-O-acyltransferase PlsY [Cognatiyoonia koreensis]SEW38925.1 acyl-phosphate glycerol-3-phosphate acyltransferase [Cognatiyoonia koreensis]